MGLQESALLFAIEGEEEERIVRGTHI